jgi:hypothetical protein
MRYGILKNLHPAYGPFPYREYTVGITDETCGGKVIAYCHEDTAESLVYMLNLVWQTTP